GWLAGVLGPRPVFAIRVVLPVLVAVSTWFVPRLPAVSAPSDAGNPLGAGKAQLVVAVGLSYAALGVVLEALSVPFGQEIILLVSGALIVLLLHGVVISRAAALGAFALVRLRAAPGAGQGFNYWAIDHLGFDHEFLGVLAQVSAVLSLAGLIVFRKPITHRPGSAPR